MAKHEFGIMPKALGMAKDTTDMSRRNTPAFQWMMIM